MLSRTEKYLLSSVASKDFVHKLRALANVCLWMRSLYLWPNHDDKCQMWQTLEMDTTLSHIAYSPHSVHTQAHTGKATPCRGISLMSLVRRKHFANILSSSEEIRNIYRLAQHITHLISILVLLLSSLDQCPMSSVPMGEREY